METFLEFAGRFHPLLVHLPIGILLLAVVLIWLHYFGRASVSQEVVTMSLGIGAIAAIFSCISGFLLSQSGEYDRSSIQWHQWMGISVAVISTGIWWIAKQVPAGSLRWASLIMTLSIVVAGHLGASITHGSSFLIEPLSGAGTLLNDEYTEIDRGKTMFYADLIQPVLERNCYTCHGPTKQKGKLRLDSRENILRGGKHGEIIVTGSPEESKLIERLRLPMDDEHHMPPKEKRQPDANEIRMITLWVESGASFDGTVEDIISAEKWNELMATDIDVVSDIPETAAPSPDENLMRELMNAGVSISRISEGNNYLQANFASAGDKAATLLSRMKPLENNIAWLKLGYTAIGDSAMSTLSRFHKLTRLHLEHTRVTDVGVEKLQDLKALVYLNLSGTGTTAQGVAKLKSLEKLRSLHLFETRVDSTERALVRQLFPNTEVEFGGFEVPLLATDTTFLK